MAFITEVLNNKTAFKDGSVFFELLPILFYQTKHFRTTIVLSEYENNLIYILLKYNLVKSYEYFNELHKKRLVKGVVTCLFKGKFITEVSTRITFNKKPLIEQDPSLTINHWPRFLS